MKRCIVLSGQYRTFDDTWPRIKQFIDLNNLDVYCQLWTTGNPVEDEEQLKRVQDRLQPIRIVQTSSEIYNKEFTEIELRIQKANPKTPQLGKLPDKIAGNASMNYARKIAFNLIDQEYDTLVYCRYDLDFFDVFKFRDPPLVVVPKEQSYGLISDIFAIMPFKYAKYFFLFDEYERLHSTKFEAEFVEYLKSMPYPDKDIDIHMLNRYCPHMMMVRHFAMNKIPYYCDNIPVRIQR